MAAVTIAARLRSVRRSGGVEVEEVALESISKFYTAQFTFHQNKLHCAVYFPFPQAAAP